MITDFTINEDAKQRYYDAGYWTHDTVRDAWSKAVAMNPDKVYVSDDQGSSFTYRTCDEGADRVAAWLMAKGIQAGDVVTVQLPTWAEFAPLFLGIMKAGAVLHPVARNYSAADLAYVMNIVGSRAFMCPTFHHKTDHEQVALEVLDQVPTLSRDRILLVDKVNPARTPGLATLDCVRRMHAPAQLPAVDADSIAVILSTSGTTGKPKQALLTHNNILFSERTFVSGLPLDDASIMFMPSPLNHATGLFHGVISPFLLGGSVVLQQDFKAEAAIDLVNRTKATWAMGATPFIYDILHSMVQHGTRTPSLKLFLCGGAPLPGNLIACARFHGITLCECYGSTESCPHVYVPPEHCAVWNGAWSGVALPGIEIRIVDNDRHEVPRGVQGEEASRGPHMFAGYLNDARRTDEALDDDGWFYSGDLCTMDEQGRIRINGRKKEIIIRGGENISAREVDERVEGWPHMVDHATIGMPDERLGERICLFAVPSPEAPAELCLSDLTAFLEERGVAKRLWPERLEAIGAIPRTATGKVKRHELAAELKRRMGLE